MGIYINNEYFPCKDIVTFSLPEAKQVMKIVTTDGQERRIRGETLEATNEIITTFLSSNYVKLAGTYRFNASLVMPIVDHPTLRHGVVEVKFDDLEERNRFATYALEKFFPRYALNGEKEWGVPQRVGSSLVFRTSMFYRKGDMIEKLHVFLENLEPFFEHFVLERSPYAFL